KQAEENDRTVEAAQQEGEDRVENLGIPDEEKKKPESNERIEKQLTHGDRQKERPNTDAFRGADVRVFAQEFGGVLVAQIFRTDGRILDGGTRVPTQEPQSAPFHNHLSSLL